MGNGIPIGAIAREFSQIQTELDEIQASVKDGKDPQQLVAETEKHFRTLESQLKGKVPANVLSDLGNAAANMAKLVKEGVKNPEVWDFNVSAPFNEAKDAVIPSLQEEEEGGPSGAA